MSAGLFKSGGRKEVSFMENANSKTIDDLGRVIIPVKLREEMGWDARDEIEIYKENDTIVLRKV